MKTGFIFIDTPINDEIVVDIPAQVSSKVRLLEILGEGLRFPDYFGVNWDAFEECIRDLSWLSEHDIAIRHVDLPLADDVEAARIYLVILMDATEKWSKQSAHQLRIIFPSQLKTVVENLIKQG